MKRNANVELLRAASVLSVMWYHFSEMSGKGMSHSLVSPVLLMGGELGVTMMFVISGFGIYMLLEGKDYSYGAFVKSRFWKLAPEYYLCIGILLLLTDQAVYLDVIHIPNLLTHALFLHSLIPSHSAAISGVLWTLGVSMQFYLLAYWIYKLQKKSVLFSLALMGLSMLIKFWVFHFWLPGKGIESGHAYFVYGRQIYTALDNFIMGMLAAQLVRRGKLPGEKLALVLGLVTAGLLLVWMRRGFASLYQDTLLSHIWHILCATLCAALIYFACALRELKGIFVKPFHFVAKYSYGMYLWHLVITYTILENCGWTSSMRYVVLACILTAVSCGAGYVSARLGKALQPKAPAKIG